MTTGQAADLRLRWKQKTTLPACRHVMLELETSDAGFLTGDYICIVCGEVARKVQAWGGGMSTLMWTRERPTKPGWYWWRRNSHYEPDILRIEFLGVKAVISKDQNALDAPDGEWIGPLDLPI